MMEIERIRAEKAKMEGAILEATCSAVATFRRATGLVPSAIELFLVSVERGGIVDDHAVSRVSATVTL